MRNIWYFNIQQDYCEFGEGFLSVYFFVFVFNKTVPSVVVIVVVVVVVVVVVY